MSVITRSLTIFIASVLLAGAAFAQGPEGQSDQRSFRVNLYVVAGSGERAASDKVKNAVKDLGDVFDIGNLKIGSAFYQRISGGGSGSISSIQRDFAGYSIENQPVFTEWQVNVLDAQGAAGTVGFRRFFFKARVPSMVQNAVTYQSVETNVNNVRVWLGKPAVVATLKAPMSDSVLFLVLEAELADPA